MSNRYVLAGLAFLIPAIVGAVLLVTDFLFSTGTAIAATTLVGVSLIVFWGVLPLRRRAYVKRQPLASNARTRWTKPTSTRMTTPLRNAKPVWRLRLCVKISQ